MFYILDLKIVERAVALPSVFEMVFRVKAGAIVIHRFVLRHHFEFRINYPPVQSPRAELPRTRTRASI